MIADCQAADFDNMLAVINEAAASYRDIIPADRWHDPYMGSAELNGEISAGVAFRGYVDAAAGLIGVMGAQPVADVLLIRHQYQLAAPGRRLGVDRGFAGKRGATGPGRNLVGGGLGHRVLSETRVRSGVRGGKRSIAAALLAHTGAADRNLGCLGERSVVGC